jgi:DMSO/TMAO reductase YedYZ molybdopterin-dependent catalytic subunit
MKYPRLIPFIIVLFLAAFMALYVVNTLFGGFGGPRPLSSVEVRDYQGERLSSIYDFRENSINGPQNVDINNYTLSISGMVKTPEAFTYDEIINGHQNYKKAVTLKCVEGWDATILYEGVLVKDIIKEAGADPGATVIVFYARDGYSTSFPLSYIMDNDIILAYKMNNLTLIPERGYPFQLVAEEKWGYKWIKWVTKIELRNTSYTGYWESRGYSNDGDLNKSFFR